MTIKLFLSGQVFAEESREKLFEALDKLFDIGREGRLHVLKKVMASPDCRMRTNWPTVDVNNSSFCLKGGQKVIYGFIAIPEKGYVEAGIS